MWVPLLGLIWLGATNVQATARLLRTRLQNQGNAVMLTTGKQFSEKNHKISFEYCFKNNSNISTEI